MSRISMDLVSLEQDSFNQIVMWTSVCRRFCTYHKW